MAVSPDFIRKTKTNLLYQACAKGKEILLAILISCLGLFGLAAFTAQRRIKEIGIRKILGASDYGIVCLLTSDFTKIVLVAIFIGLPISYYAATRWLEAYAYKIDLEWWYFGSTGLAALLIAWF